MNSEAGGKLKLGTWAGIEKLIEILIEISIFFKLFSARFSRLGIFKDSLRILENPSNAGIVFPLQNRLEVVRK